MQTAAEQAERVSLSKLPRTSVTCTHGGQVLTVPLSRAEFETLTRDLLIRTKLTVQQLMRQAGLGWEQVDRVLLVGGSTHMPMTRQMLEELAGQPPDQSLAVSEVVARGAALHAGITAARQSRGGATPRPYWRPKRPTPSARWSRSTSTLTAWASKSSRGKSRSTTC